MGCVSLGVGRLSDLLASSSLPIPCHPLCFSDVPALTPDCSGYGTYRVKFPLRDECPEVQSCVLNSGTRGCGRNVTQLDHRVCSDQCGCHPALASSSRGSCCEMSHVSPEALTLPPPWKLLAPGISSTALGSHFFSTRAMAITLQDPAAGGGPSQAFSVPVLGLESQCMCHVMSWMLEGCCEWEAKGEEHLFFKKQGAGAVAQQRACLACRTLWLHLQDDQKK